MEDNINTKIYKELHKSIRKEQSIGKWAIDTDIIKKHIHMAKKLTERCLI